MRRTFKKLRSLVLSAAIIPMIFATPAHAIFGFGDIVICLLYTSPSPRDGLLSRMPSSA